MRIGWIAALALAAYLTIGIILAGRGTPPIPPTMQAVNLLGGHVRGNRITTRSWSFDYRNAELSPDGITGSVNGVRHGVIFKNGKPYMKISAEHVSVNTQSLDFTALGKVDVERIADKQKRSFDTDLVEWTNATKMLLMPHPCYVHTEGQTLRISHITVDFATDEIHFGKIEGGVQLKK
ncbi:MAG: hypothetical protein ACYDGM_05360 [Vulcanimicrobiaceae bacterium]